MKRLLLLLPLLCVACGGQSVRHIATVSVVAGNAALVEIDKTLDAVTCSDTVKPPCLSVEDRKHKAAPRMVQALDWELKALNAVRDLPDGAPRPAEVAQYLAEVGKAIDDLLGMIPQSAPKTQLLARIGGK